MHGGASTGPKTPEGLSRSSRARWKHGERSLEAREKRTADAQRALWEAEAETYARAITARLQRRRYR
jgi:hypothetical protein